MEEGRRCRQRETYALAAAADRRISARLLFFVAFDTIGLDGQQQQCQQESDATTPGAASEQLHTISAPAGKFQVFGKPAHCRGLTGWIAQSRPSRKTHSWSRLVDQRETIALRAQPREALDEVGFAPTRGSRVIAAISASPTRTKPGQRQQFVQRWQR